MENRRNWRELCQLAASEKDGRKLMEIIAELNQALAEDEDQRRAILPKNKRLLFVDDEPSIRLTLPPLLQLRGFDVDVVASLPEALNAMQNRTFDVLLSDLNINQAGDGITLVRAIRRINPSCATVILTGYPAYETAKEAIQYDVDGYIEKPADIDVLISTLERLIEKHQKPESLVEEARNRQDSQKHDSPRAK